MSRFAILFYTLKVNNQELGEVKSQHFEAESKIAELSTQLSVSTEILQSTKMTEQERYEKLKGKVDFLENLKKVYEKNATVHEKTIKSLNEKLGFLETEQSELKQLLTEKEGEISKLRKNLKEQKNEFEQASEELRKEYETQLQNSESRLHDSVSKSHEVLSDIESSQKLQEQTIKELEGQVEGLRSSLKESETSLKSLKDKYEIQISKLNVSSLYLD